MESAGYCQKGDACTFAHSPAELANGDENANGSSNLDAAGIHGLACFFEATVVDDTQCCFR